MEAPEDTLGRVVGRMRVLAAKVTELEAAHTEGLRLGEQDHRATLQTAALAGEAQARLRELVEQQQQQQRLLKAVVDEVQLNAGHALAAQNSMHARHQLHIKALRQRLLASELQQAVAVEKLEQLEARTDKCRGFRWSKMFRGTGCFT